MFYRIGPNIVSVCHLSLIFVGKVYQLEWSLIRLLLGFDSGSLTNVRLG
jgi:hypothetical protein